MNFAAAAQLSATGLHIRRESWAADRWLIRWLGGWHLQTAEVNHLVEFDEYTEEDLLAEDWTTMPAPLAACPIDPATGSTGGSVSAPPGAPAGVPSVDDAGGVPLFSVDGALPGGPKKKTTFKPRPRPVTSCTFGALVLEAIPGSANTLAVELTATGMSAGNYSVLFHVGALVVPGELIAGPNDTASATITDLGAWVGKPLVVTATVTAHVEGDCKGQQRQVRKLIDPYYPAGVCASPAFDLFVTITGLVESDPEGYITGAAPNGTHRCSWYPEESCWLGIFTSGHYDDGDISIDMTWYVRVTCFAGDYLPVVDVDLTGGNAFYAGAGATGAGLGVVQTNYSTGDWFTGGSVIVNLAP